MEPDSRTEAVVDRIFEGVADTARAVGDSLADRRGTVDEENPSGERQLAADLWADERLVERLGDLEGVGTLASEERDEPVDVGSGLAVAMDPLDGSSNLASNNLMGTIIGVYDAPSFPAAGQRMIAAGYVLFGPTTTMVTAVGDEVVEAVIDEGGRRVVEPALRLPEEPTVYGFGGRVPDWPEPIEGFVREIETELKLRYGGALVGDVNQVLAYGGIFAYPTLTSRPAGKLRLQFEAMPMGYIVEAAGGRSSDGRGSLLDRRPTDLHQRTPLYLGTGALVDRLEAVLEG